MLHLVLGRAGSGKTTYIRNQLKERGEDAPPILIVPEQSSFQNERAMLRLLGAEDARRVRVLSFSRLAERAFMEYGGVAGRRLDDGGRSVLMSLALEQVRDHLEFYRKSAENTELTGLLLGLSAEFKMCEIRPGDLEKTASGGAALPSALRQKLRELSLILSAYEALVAQSYIDPQDDLTRLAALLEDHPYFEGAVVAIDSFQSFTMQEYRIIRHILRQSADLYITLCADVLDDPEEGTGLFSVVRRTGRILIRMAREENIRVAAPLSIPAGARFHARGLAALEAGVYRAERSVLSPAEGVHIYEARDLYDEAEYVSATIRRLVMEEGFRYRDFAVIARSPENYMGILESALDHRDIPYFMDEPQRTDAEPIMRLVLCAFRIVKSGFDSDDVFLYLKTGLAGLSTEEISLLENYTFLWRLSGRKWCEKWTEHPQGFAESWSGPDRMALEDLNRLRECVTDPLLRFSAELEEADGEKMAGAVYRLLENTGAANHLRALADRLLACGRPDLAERQLRLWDLLMEILDQAALVLHERRLSPTRFAELLRLIILTRELASIPQGLDEITVGAANRIRTEEPRVVFLLGAAQGEFPQAPGTVSVFSNSERRDLIALGLPLNDTEEGVAVQERFLAYSAMSAASHRLFLSWPMSGSGGEGKLPSSIITETRAVLANVPASTERRLEETWFANSEQAAFELAARVWTQDNTLSATLRELFSRRPGYERRAEALTRAAQRKEAAFADPARARVLFGMEMELSATQIETFYLCRFQYFCRYGMNARERRTAELDALEYGSLMHYLLERLFRETGAQRIAAMDPEELRAVIVALLEEYLAGKLGGRKGKTARFTYLFGRLADSAVVIVGHTARELCQSEFQPRFFEYPIGEDGQPQMILPLPDGGEAHIRGKVDRVDFMEKNGVEYVRVIDYKTGKKEFRLSDVVYGVNMQMLIYLAAMSQNGEKPAGVLYVPATPPSLSVPRGTDLEHVSEEEDKKLRMNGLILEEEEVLRGMEPEGKGKYIPVVLKDGAPARRDSVVTQTELGGILEHIRTLITAMGSELHKGNIGAKPLSGAHDACAWCPYAPVCGHEEQDPVRESKKQDRQGAIGQLTQPKEDREGGKA